MADGELNPNNDANVARYKRLKKAIALFVAFFFGVLLLFTAVVYRAAPSPARCRFRLVLFLMSLCAGLIDFVAIMATSVSLVEVLMLLRDGGVVIGNWRIGVVVAGNFVVAACLAVFLWLIYEFPCRGV